MLSIRNVNKQNEFIANRNGLVNATETKSKQMLWTQKGKSGKRIQSTVLPSNIDNLLGLGQMEAMSNLIDFWSDDFGPKSCPKFSSFRHTHTHTHEDKSI